MILLHIDRATAAHLAVALRRHRRSLERAGQAVPAGLAELDRLAESVARGQTVADGGSRSMPVVGGSYVGPHVHDDAQELVTQAEVARRLGVDRRTVARWVDRGELRHVLVAGRRRIPRRELARLEGRPA